MTTSGTVTYDPVRDVVINGALRLCGAYNAANSPRPEQVQHAIEACDMMLNSWVIDDFLYLKKFIYITLVADQASYVLSTTTTDAVHSDLAATLDFLQRPARVFFPTRHTVSSTQEVPLTQISREEYTTLPNKATTGTTTQVYYDPQIVAGRLYIWPVPSDAVDKIILTVTRRIEDVGADTDTYDAPPEMLEMIKYQLALRLSLEYGLTDPQIARLERYAVALKDKIDGLNRDNASAFFQPDMR